MDFAYTPKVEELRGRLLAFMDEHVYPAEALYEHQMAESGDSDGRPLVVGMVTHAPPPR